MSPFISNFFVSRWRGISWAAWIVLVFCIAYGPALAKGPYGINDDYQYLYRVHHGTFDPVHNEQMGMGRPVASWGLNAAYFLCGGLVRNLVWLRCLALLGVVLFVATLFWTLVACGCSGTFAATVAGVVGLSPSCGVYAAWAASLFSPYALAGALLAGRLITNPRWTRWVAGILLLLGVCGTWQAAAPLALFPALFREWRWSGLHVPLPRKDMIPWWRPWLACTIAVVAYAVICRVASSLGWTPLAGKDRLALTNDPLAKLRLFGDVLRSGVTSWARLQPGFWEWSVGLVTTGACLGALLAWRDGRVRWPMVGRRSALALGMLVLSVAPLLLAQEDNAAFRALPILYLTVAFLGAHGLRRSLTAWPAWVRVSASLALLGLNAGAARYHVWHGLVEPNLREYVGLRDQVRRQFKSGQPERLVYLLPPPTLLAAGRLKPSWEYGLVSSSFWWVTRPFLLLLWEESSPTDRPPLELTILYREAENAGVPVLDPLPVLLRETGVWRDDPIWGRLRVFGGSWCYSQWFGYLNVAGFPVVQHHLLGSLLYISRQSDGGSLWFYRPGLGNFHTSSQAFPSLFLSRSDHWFYLSDDDPTHALLYDLTTRQRSPLPR